MFAFIVFLRTEIIVTSTLLFVLGVGSLLAPKLAIQLWEQAEARAKQGRYGDAEQFRRQHALLDKIVRPHALQTIIAINELGLNLYEQGRDQEAATVFAEAIEIRALKGEPILEAAIMNKSYHRLRRYSDAESLYKKSLSIRKNWLGEHYSLTDSEALF
jgi:tetratricopeptide (TPR) repeat protein